MKKFIFIAVLAVAGLVAGAQKTIHDANAEVRPVSSFHAINISNAFDVIITQSNSESLAVSASEKQYNKHIKTAVENGVLKIWYDDDKKWWPSNRKLKAYISLKNIDQLKAGGASDIKIEGGLKAASLKVQLSGATDLSGQLTIANDLEVHLSGASDMSITGAASKVAIDASGASEVKAYDFKATTCSVDASGASSVRISVDKELSAKLSGASSVSYKGDALIRDIKTSGASSISRKS